MKLQLSIPLLLLMISCNSTTEKKQENQTSNQPKEDIGSSPKTNTDSSLKQNADYTILFMRNEKDCDLMTQSEMATLLKVDESNINPRNIGNGYCWFDMNLNDGSKTTLGLHPLVWDKKSITQHINSLKEMETDFGKGNQQGIVLMSDSNDTYFGIRGARGELYMLNPNYDNGILIQFGSAVEAATKNITYTEEQKKERFDNAVAVANFLLKKYKK